MNRRVVIQKTDLDTVLTAFLLDVSEADEIIVVRDKASDEDLVNPDVICIECGGSGQTEFNNFDHHDTDQPLPPACAQVFRLRYGPSDKPLLERLVEYASALDTHGPEALKQRSQLPEEAFPTLSDIFSGMLLVTRDPREQLLRGIAILKRVQAQQIDPFGLMPELPEWENYIEAKRQNNEAIQKAIAHARFFQTKSGLRAGFIETDVTGALGALYHLGCQVVIAYSPRFGNPPVPKYTIASNGMRVDKLLPILNKRESGWGGPAHRTIVGSPRTGSTMKPEEVLMIVREHL